MTWGIKIVISRHADSQSLGRYLGLKRSYEPDKMIIRKRFQSTQQGQATATVMRQVIAVLSVCAGMILSGTTIGKVGGSNGGVVFGSNSPYGSISSGSGSLGANTASPSTDMVLSFGQNTGGLNNTNYVNNSVQPIYTAQSNSVSYNSTTSGIPNTSTVLGGNYGGAAPSWTAGSIQPIDPYATPTQSSLFASTSVPGTVPNTVNNSIPPSAISPGDPNVYSGQWDRVMPETYQAMRRFRESTSVDYTFMPGGSKVDSFGINEIDLRMQLSIPCRFIPNHVSGQSGPGYFYIAPGGSLAWWDGPVGPPHMSPNGFGAFVDLGLTPQFNDVFALDAWFRLGVYSDFKKVKSDAIRYQGRILGLFAVSPRVKIVAGVQYLDRVRVKILPTGGVIWTPTEDWELRLTFPNPKISKRLWNNGRTLWTGYVTADYGGGSWYISELGQTDYNDIRVGLGLEFETITRVNGHIEIGGSFDRELRSKHWAARSLDNAFYLKIGFVF